MILWFKSLNHSLQSKIYDYHNTDISWWVGNSLNYTVFLYSCTPFGIFYIEIIWDLQNSCTDSTKDACVVFTQLPIINILQNHSSFLKMKKSDTDAMLFTKPYCFLISPAFLLMPLFRSRILSKMSHCTVFLSPSPTIHDSQGAVNNYIIGSTGSQ